MSLKLVELALEEHDKAVASVKTLARSLEECARRLKEIFATDGRVMICGNGGSAADAQHFAAELTGRFERERRGLPAIALTTDSSALTAIGNDYGFEAIFARQVEAVASPGDLLIAISTSGNSVNLLRAVEAAHKKGVFVVGLLGRDGGKLAAMVDLPLIVASVKTARIQEAHILILHLLCEMIETEL